jgi:2-methylisocitrate lyase-like PEP mutase family enzyme
MPTKILDEEEAVLKIRAALAARKDPDFLVFATSAQKQHRLVNYAEIGAQGVLFPWERVAGETADPDWLARLERFKELGTILVAVATPFVRPIDLDELRKLGFKIVVFAAEALYASARVQTDLWDEVMRTGTTRGFADRMYTRQQDFMPLVQEARMRELSRQFLPSTYESSEDMAQFVNR